MARRDWYTPLTSSQTPAMVSPAYTPTQTNQIVNAPPDLSWIGKIAMDPSKGGTPVLAGATKGAFSRPGDDAYGQALTKEQARIEKAIADYTAQWDKDWSGKEAALKAEIEDAANQFLRHQSEKAKKVDEAMAWAEANGRPWKPRSYYEQVIGVSPAEENVAKALWKLQNDLGVMQKNREADRTKALSAYSDPLYKTYLEADKLAGEARREAAGIKAADAEYEKALNDYNNAKTQYEKDKAAYNLYVAQKKVYDADVIQREADIKAGRYAVNPYLYMAQGATLPEIQKLREQMDAGNLRPNMKVPDAPVAPTEIKDPGEWKTDAPVHKAPAAPLQYTPEAAALIGYTPPKIEEPKPVDTSINVAETPEVESTYKAPEVTPDKPTPKVDDTQTDSSGNVVVPAATTQGGTTGAGTLQQTSQGAAAPTQQTAVAAATPPPALPEQPAGTVGGQADTTGQVKEDEAPPTPDAKPQPFASTDDAEKEKEEDEATFGQN